MSTVVDRAVRRVLADPDQFRRQGYVVVPQFIEPALAAFLWSYVHTKFACRLLGSGGPLVPNSLGGYGDQVFDGLLEYVRPQVEKRCGLGLLPTYSHFRLYRRGDALRRHRDRPACEISVTLNVGQEPDEPWPIYIERDGAPHAALLAPGDAMLYRGCDCFHWRNAYQGSRLVQVFLHYVDRDGPHADQKYDGRQSLMRPRRDRRPDENPSDDMPRVQCEQKNG